MKRIAIVFALVVLSAAANAGTDYQCVNNCTNNGYTYQTCQDQCTIKDDYSQDGMARQREKDQERYDNNDRINAYGMQCRNGNMNACAEVERLQRNR